VRCFSVRSLTIVFRQKYPRWWFDWNLELQRFGSRVVAYLALMDDRYPSTDDHQAVRLDYAYPDASADLNRWLPLVEVVPGDPPLRRPGRPELAAVAAVVAAWCAILVTGPVPRGLFGFVEGVIRWNDRVIGYALTLVTDEYPPFRLSRSHRTARARAAARPPAWGADDHPRSHAPLPEAARAPAWPGPSPPRPKPRRGPLPGRPLPRDSYAGEAEEGTFHVRTQRESRSSRRRRDGAPGGDAIVRPKGWSRPTTPAPTRSTPSGALTSPSPAARWSP
jgi:hypothetical protein